MTRPGILRLLRRRSAAALALAAVAAGCGGRAAQAPRPPVLAAAAVPYLPSSVRSLAADDVAPPKTLAGLAGDLERWGFRAGAERSFQGQSRRLQVVVSRTLEFRSAAGARSYVRYVHTHAGAVLGATFRQEALRSRGRRGWSVRLASCSCHMASPALVGIASRGRRVTWLEVNGPRAGARALERLFAEAP
jgi:hypothetical protein